MSYRFERLELLFNQVFPNTMTVIELDHIIEGYTVYLKKEKNEICVEIPASDFVTHYLNPPPSNLKNLYEETQRILRRLNIVKQSRQWLA